MKKWFPAVFLLAFPLAASGEDKIKAADLTGNWKETARLSPDKMPQPYTDTIRMEFLVGNEYIWGKANSFLYRGTFKVNGQQLELGARIYTIVEAGKNRLLLKDDAGLHEFSRYRKDAPRTDNTQASSGDRARQTEAYDGVKDFSQLRGKWQVYKRTSAKQQKTIDYDRIIKQVEFSSGKEGDKGLIYAAKDGEGRPSWYVDRFKDNVLFCKGRDERRIKVLKCADGELVLEEGDMTYFFKQF